MKYLAAYALLVLGGNATPSEDDVSKLLAAAGINADKERLTQLSAALRGKTLHEVISEGMGKIAAMPAGGAAPAAAADAPKAEEKDEKKEEPVEEKEEVVGMMNLFDEEYY